VAQLSPNFAVQQLVDQSQVQSLERCTAMLEPSAPPLEPSAPPLGRMGAAMMQRQATAELSSANLEVLSARTYQVLGLPPALAKVVAEQESEVALRIYLLDNSGSMSIGDGAILSRGQRGEIKKQPATRWEELIDLAKCHGEWNGALGVPTEFVLLNSPSPRSPVQGRDYFTIDGEDWREQVASMTAALQSKGPGGSTPLGERLEDVCVRLKQNRAALEGRRVNLTIVTDGVPDSRPRLVQSIRRIMAELPVRLVIRLCTDEDSVVEFYNDLDKDVEMPLDIIDDLLGEAREIYRKNPFLVYTPALQMVREAGARLPVLDFLDERRLTPMEAAFLSQLLVQQEGREAYSRDPQEFLAAIGPDVAAAPLVFDTVKRRFVPPVNVRALSAAIMPSWYGQLSQQPVLEAGWFQMVVAVLVAILFVRLLN